MQDESTEVLVCSNRATASVCAIVGEDVGSAVGRCAEEVGGRLRRVGRVFDSFEAEFFVHGV